MGFKPLDAPSNNNSNDGKANSNTPFVCEICGKGLYTKESLQHHMLTDHPNRAKPFKCKKCNACFETPEELAKHQRKERKKEAKKQKAAQQKASQKKEAKIQKNQNRFKCEKCGNYFDTQKN